MRRFFRNNGGQPTLSYLQYLGTYHFLEATMENWESEFPDVFLSGYPSGDS